MLNKAHSLCHLFPCINSDLQQIYIKIGINIFNWNQRIQLSVYFKNSPKTRCASIAKSANQSLKKLFILSTQTLAIFRRDKANPKEMRTPVDRWTDQQKSQGTFNIARVSYFKYVLVVCHSQADIEGGTIIAPKATSVRDKILLVDGEQHTFVHACIYAAEVRKTEKEKREKEKEREGEELIYLVCTPLQTQRKQLYVANYVATLIRTTPAE